MPLFDFAQLLSPAQLSGYAAFVLGVTAFLQRKDRRLKLFLVGECVVYVVHFTLLGNLPAASSAGVSGVRTFLSIRLRSRWLALIFMAIYLGIGIALDTTGVRWLPVVGGGVATWGMFVLHGTRMRLVVLASTVLWLINNILSGSIGGTVLEAFIATASLVTIVRMIVEARRGDAAAPPLVTSPRPE